MNLFFDYQKKIFKSFKLLEKKSIIKIPSNIKPFLLNQTISKIEPLNNFNRVFETHSSDEIIQLVKESMENAMKFKVPIKVDYNCGQTWYDAH